MPLSSLFGDVQPDIIVGTKPVNTYVYLEPVQILSRNPKYLLHILKTIKISKDVSFHVRQKMPVCTFPWNFVTNLNT
jgi:hypothetical protein